MITKSKFNATLMGMFKNMDEFKYENYGRDLYMLLEGQTPDCFTDDLIDEGYDYDDLQEINLDQYVYDGCVEAIKNLEHMNQNDAESKFNLILKNLEKDYDREFSDEDEVDEEEEETKYDTINLDLELYHEPGKNSGNWCIWIGDRIGGSGIDVKGSTKEECAEEAAKYLVDYLYRLK